MEDEKRGRLACDIHAAAAKSLHSPFLKSGKTLFIAFVRFGSQLSYIYYRVDLETLAIASGEANLALKQTLWQLGLAIKLHCKTHPRNRKWYIIS